MLLHAHLGIIDGKESSSKKIPNNYMIDMPVDNKTPNNLPRKCKRVSV